ncbi:MAG: zinc-dependent metalloprotease [Actinomycetes bacterium]
MVGLQLRPRRLRDAATVWAAMGQQHGSADRDALWAHPDLLPTSEDLDEPLDFVARQGLDDELAALTADDAGRSAADGGTGAGDGDPRRDDDPEEPPAPSEGRG